MFVTGQRGPALILRRNLRGSKKSHAFVVGNCLTEQAIAFAPRHKPTRYQKSCSQDRPKVVARQVTACLPSRSIRPCPTGRARCRLPQFQYGQTCGISFVVPVPNKIRTISISRSKHHVHSERKQKWFAVRDIPGHMLETTVYFAMTKSAL